MKCYNGAECAMAFHRGHDILQYTISLCPLSLSLPAKCTQANIYSIDSDLSHRQMHYNIFMLHAMEKVCAIYSHITENMNGNIVVCGHGTF